jgi:hypothetical protein
MENLDNQPRPITRLNYSPKGIAQDLPTSCSWIENHHTQCLIAYKGTSALAHFDTQAS